MSRAEYDTMVATGQVQPDLYGKDLKHATSPPNPDGYRASDAGSIFVEFDVSDTQIANGGRNDWIIIYGPNNPRGILAARHDHALDSMPAAENIRVISSLEINNGH